jgi:hypothetical protein
LRPSAWFLPRLFFRRGRQRVKEEKMAGPSRRHADWSGSASSFGVSTPQNFHGAKKGGGFFCGGVCGDVWPAFWQSETIFTISAGDAPAFWAC